MKRVLKSQLTKLPRKQKSKINPSKKQRVIIQAGALTESKSVNGGIKSFFRKIRHATLGEMQEKAFIKQGTLKSDPSGKLQITAPTFGRIGEISFEKTNKKGTFLLHSLEVVPWARKQGFGTQIFLSTIELLKKQLKAEKIILNVDKKDAQVIEMYKRTGFMESKETVLGKTNPLEIQMVLKLKTAKLAV